MADFFIIVPTSNSEKHLERCLASVLMTQSGRHTVDIRIQDNRSRDKTERIARDWRQRGVSFSSEADTGLYDAIDKASRYVKPGQIMTWLGSDDMLLPGALDTIASIFEEMPEVSWVSGLPFVGRYDGGNFTPWSPQKFARKDYRLALMTDVARISLCKRGRFGEVTSGLKWAG